MGEAAAILLEKLAELLALSGDDFEVGIDGVDDDDDVCRIGSRVARIDLAKVEHLGWLLVVEQGKVLSLQAIEVVALLVSDLDFYGDAVRVHGRGVCGWGGRSGRGKVGCLGLGAGGCGCEQEHGEGDGDRNEGSSGAKSLHDASFVKREGGPSRACW